MLPPLGDLHRIECWLLHHGLRLKVILRPALPRHGLLYERSALLASATEEFLHDSALETRAVTAWPQERQLFDRKLVLPQGLAP